MRKLKLQMQLSIDGFVAGPNHEMDWMSWNWDDEIKKYVAGITEPVDLILLGRNLAEGFIPYWASEASKPEPMDLSFAKTMRDTSKMVFTKTLETNQWANSKLAKGDFIEEINQLKQQEGGDIIAYGGASFVASLINAGLIDEYHLFMNPVAIGKGMSIFSDLDNRLNLDLVKSISFKCGIVLLKYRPIS
jgi:dihydrofolate reductase